MRIVIGFFASLAAICLVLASTATAATVIKLDMANLVANSDAIVVAQVTEMESSREEDGRVYTTISFATDEVLKGNPGDEFTLRQVGGVDGDIATRVPGMPQFEPDEEVFLFLTNVDDQPVITGLSQGKFQIAVGPDKDTRYVVPQLHGVHFVNPADQPGSEPAGDPGAEAVKPNLEPPPVDISSHAEVYRQVHQFDAFRQRIKSVIEKQQESAK